MGSPAVALYKGKYRAESTRLSGWDYGATGWYYITICTRDRQPFFGDIRDGAVRLSPIGESARSFWLEIPSHFPAARLDEFIVMPNHVHGILVLNHGFGTDPGPPRFGPLKQGSLSKVVQAYKSAVKRKAAQMGHPFGWQPRFFDHVVRTEESLPKIRRYIQENPLHEDGDEESFPP
jgi:putative transposase